MSRPMAETPKRRPRRRFDDDFKAQAVRLVLDEGKSVGSVARDLDLTETALREWVNRARADRTHGKTGLTNRSVRSSPASGRKTGFCGRSGEIQKGGGLLRERAAVRFRFIAAEKAHHSLNLLCRCLRVTRSGSTPGSSGPSRRGPDGTASCRRCVRVVYWGQGGTAARGFTGTCARTTRSASAASG